MTTVSPELFTIAGHLFNVLNSITPHRFMEEIRNVPREGVFFQFEFIGQGKGTVSVYSPYLIEIELTGRPQGTKDETFFFSNEAPATNFCFLYFRKGDLSAAARCAI